MYTVCVLCVFGWLLSVCLFGGYVHAAVFCVNLERCVYNYDGMHGIVCLYKWMRVCWCVCLSVWCALPVDILCSLTSYSLDPVTAFLNWSHTRRMCFHFHWKCTFTSLFIPPSLTMLSLIKNSLAMWHHFRRFVQIPRISALWTLSVL